MRGLPGEDALRQPGHDREGRDRGPGEAHLGAGGAGRSAQPPHPGAADGQDRREHGPGPRPEELGHHRGADREAEQHDGEDVGGPQGDGGRRGLCQGHVGPAHDADDAQRLAEAQGQDVVGAEGEVDAGQRLAERQAGQDAAPRRRPQEEGRSERRHGEHDDQGAVGHGVGALPQRLDVHGVRHHHGSHDHDEEAEGERPRAGAGASPSALGGRRRRWGSGDRSHSS